MKMSNNQGVTSIVVDGVSYSANKKGEFEVDSSHAAHLLDFGFSPINENDIVESAAPTQEEIDQMHKAAAALTYIEAWNADHPDAPIGPDAEKLKADYEAKQKKAGE